MFSLQSENLVDIQSAMERQSKIATLGNILNLSNCNDVYITQADIVNSYGNVLRCFTPCITCTAPVTGLCSNVYTVHLSVLSNEVNLNDIN
jgi:hypothetical protein